MYRTIHYQRYPINITPVFPAVFVILWSSGFVGAKLGPPYAQPATCLLPIGTALLSGWLLRERVSPKQWMGLTLGLAGVVAVVADRIVVAQLSTAAVLLSVLALGSITLGTVWLKRHGAGVDLRTGAAIQFLAAAVVMAPFAFFFETLEVRWTGEFVFALAWLVVVLSLGAIFLLLYLIRHGAASRVASLFYLVPPSTALMAWALFGETYSLAAAAGMGLAMLAVWLVTKS